MTTEKPATAFTIRRHRQRLNKVLKSCNEGKWGHTRWLFAVMEYPYRQLTELHARLDPDRTIVIMVPFDLSTPEIRNLVAVRRKFA